MDSDTHYCGLYVKLNPEDIKQDYCACVDLPSQPNTEVICYTANSKFSYMMKHKNICSYDPDDLFVDLPPDCEKVDKDSSYCGDLPSLPLPSSRDVPNDQ